MFILPRQDSKNCKSTLSAASFWKRCKAEFGQPRLVPHHVRGSRDAAGITRYGEAKNFPLVWTWIRLRLAIQRFSFASMATLRLPIAPHLPLQESTETHRILLEVNSTAVRG